MEGKDKKEQVIFRTQEVRKCPVIGAEDEAGAGWERSQARMPPCLG